MQCLLEQLKSFDSAGNYQNLTPCRVHWNRRHAIITVGDHAEECTLEDLGSTNKSAMVDSSGELSTLVPGRIYSYGSVLRSQPHKNCHCATPIKSPSACMLLSRSICSGCSSHCKGVIQFLCLFPRLRTHTTCCSICSWRSFRISSADKGNSSSYETLQNRSSSSF